MLNKELFKQKISEEYSFIVKEKLEEKATTELEKRLVKKIKNIENFVFKSIGLFTSKLKIGDLVISYNGQIGRIINLYLSHENPEENTWRIKRFSDDGEPVFEERELSLIKGRKELKRIIDETKEDEDEIKNG